MKTRLELGDPGQGKRRTWECEVIGREVVVRASSSGEIGESQIKTYADEPAAARAAQRLIAQQRAAGYRDADAPAEAMAVEDTRRVRGVRAPSPFLAFDVGSFEGLLDGLRGDADDLRLRALLASASVIGANRARDPWIEYISARSQLEYVQRIDRASGQPSGPLLPRPVWKRVVDDQLDAPDDDAALRQLARGSLPELDDRAFDDEVRRFDAVWARSAWLAAALRRGAAEGRLPAGGNDGLDDELALPAFAEAPGCAIYWLFHCLLLDDDALALERVLVAAGASPLAVIRSAATVVRALARAERSSFAGVEDVARLRDELRARCAAVVVSAPGATPAPAGCDIHRLLPALDARPLRSAEDLAVLGSESESIALSPSLAAEDSIFERLATWPRLRALALNGALTVSPRLARTARVDMVELARADLTRLPPVLATLPRLRALQLGANPRLFEHGLPEGLLPLTGLVALGLAATGIARLPSELARLQGLTILDLAGNDFPLAAAAPILGRLRALRVLQLPRLRDLPAGIELLAHLTRLLIAGGDPAQLDELRRRLPTTEITIS